MATSGQIPSDITLAAGEALRRNAGNSAFEAFTPGGGGGSPGGSDTQIQYNNAGAFGGDADLTWDTSANELKIGDSGGSGVVSLYSSGGTYKAKLKTGGSYASDSIIEFGNWDGKVAVPSGDGNPYQVLTSTGSDQAPVWADPDWDYKTVLASDYTVTNSTTLATVTNFSYTVTSGICYYVEVIGSCTASNSTGDIKADLTMTSGSWTSGASNSTGVHYGAVGTLTYRQPTAFSSTTAAMSGGIAISNGDAVVRSFRFSFYFVCSGNGSCAFQIANVSASSGYTSTIKAGTIFRIKRV